MRPLACVLALACLLSPARAAEKKAPAPPAYAAQIAATIQPTRQVVYKNVAGRALQLDVFTPSDLRSGEKRAALVLIHGGGWTGGVPRTMYAFNEWATRLGLVSISVQYRLYKPGTDTTVFECVQDARSAVRYVREHAAEFGIDPDKIAVGGASAGGHLAAATAMFAFDAAGEDTRVSCTPNALVLFSPVIDTSPEGYGHAKLGARWEELSPAHRVRAGLPPTLTFHGTGDTTTPFPGAQRFHDAMLRAGNRSELVVADGAQHTYMFKSAAAYAATQQKLAGFLRQLGFLPLAQLATAPAAELARQTYDLVVVEATPGGIAMAVRAAREGLSVLLTNHNPHLGGILSSGLGVWDTQWEGKRSPLYDEVRQAIFEHYRTAYGETSRQYREALPGKSGHTNGKFEPRVAEKLFTALVAREKNITVLPGYYPTAVQRDGATVQSMTFRELDGTASVRVTARVFADCTYEGDVLPLARVRYRIGREARAEFNEPHAGVIFMRPSSAPPTPELAALGAKHAKLKLRPFPGYQEILPASTGAGDRNVQAFNYRTMLSSDPANRLPVEKPAGYDPEQLKKLEYGSIVSPIPNQKLGWNRPQLVGPHNDYIEADWPARRRVMEQHWQATLGLLYFMQHDPSVPEARRNEWRNYGLARDEFADHGHRPYEFYVREARRLDGRYVFTEHDASLAPGLERAPVHADSIGITEWYMDAHACTTARVPGSLDEGKMMLHQETFPGQVPYRTLLPPDLDNLLVPVCLSSTHVSWGSVRLEPTWMNLGEAAAYATLQAIRRNQPPARIDTDALTRTLAAKRVMISFFNDVDLGGPESWIPAVQYFGAKGFLADYDARPSAPLTTAVARAWAEAFASLPRGALDPMQTLRAVTAAERSAAAEPITRTAFGRLLGRTAVAGDKSLTRAEALEILWRAEP